MSLPIIKRFWPKIVPPKTGRKIHVFGSLGGENFWSWSWDPRKSIPTGTRRLTQKRWRYSQKCVLQSCARNHNRKRVYSTSYRSSIVTFVLSCPVSEISLLHVSWEERPHPYSTRILGVFPLDYIADYAAPGSQDSKLIPSLQLGTGKTAAVRLVGKSCLSVCLSALVLDVSPERVVRSTSFLACGRGSPGPRIRPARQERRDSADSIIRVRKTHARRGAPAPSV